MSYLKDECISEKDNSHGINVWNTVEMNKMSDHHELYIETDVLLLADVFDKLKNLYVKKSPSSKAIPAIFLKQSVHICLAFLTNCITLF